MGRRPTLTLVDPRKCALIPAAFVFVAGTEREKVAVLICFAALLALLSLGVFMTPSFARATRAAKAVPRGRHIKLNSGD
jgi:hypothetical protein